MTTIETLEAARKLITPDGAWTQEANARGKSGKEVLSILVMPSAFVPPLRFGRQAGSRSFGDHYELLRMQCKKMWQCSMTPILMQKFSQLLMPP